MLEPKHPLPSVLVAPLLDLDDHLRRLDIPYLLAGGMAREILLHYGYGCPSGRGTTDLDFGVTLPDWQAFQALKAALVASGRFRPDGGNAQRVLHVAADTGMETRIDLVPFGAIAATDGRLTWPPDDAHVMSVLGYQEALDGAVWMTVAPGRAVPLASASGLALLKVIAWADRGEERGGRDAVDLLEILRRAHQFLSDQELYDDHPAAMSTYDFDPVPAGAWLIGRHVSEQVAGPTAALVLEALKPEARERLLDYASRGRSPLDRDGATADEVGLVEAFARGFRSACP